jgi:uncharacterized protein (TIGR03437 family)
MFRKRLVVSARSLCVSVATISFLVSSIPQVYAQQYCVSGVIATVTNCNGCNFKAGDAVAMTFNVQSSSVKCLAAGTTSIGCTAGATFAAKVGTRFWANDTASQAAIIFLSMSSPFGTGATTAITFSANGNLSPSPNPLPVDSQLLVTLHANFSTNLLGTGSLPASLPIPAAVTAGSLIFNATTAGAGGDPTFSYTGQNCAVPSSATTVINPGGIVPVYSTASTIQTGEWVSIYGSGLASGSVTWNGDFPISLGGTSVTINGKPAYLWLVSPGQINLQAPDDNATGVVPVTVSTAGGTATSSVTLSQVAPSFSLLDSKHVTGIILRSNGSGAYGGGTYDIIGPTGTSLGYSTVAAKAGDSVELFGVGFGATNPVVPAGHTYSGAAKTSNTVSLLINNVNVTPGFAGLSSAGLYQINFTIPSGVGTGDVPLQASVGGAQTPSGVVISLR